MTQCDIGQEIRAGHLFSSQRACHISKRKPLRYFYVFVRLPVRRHDFLMTSIVIGHSKTKEATAPAAAGSVHHMLSASDTAGASSGAAATDPRTAVEAAVSAVPDDVSQGDKLKAFETGHKY